MGKMIDFDAFRAEQKNEPVTLKIGGKEYALPSALPVAVAVDLIAMRAELSDDDDLPPEALEQFGVTIFGEELWTTIIREHRISVTEALALVEQTIAMYTAPKEEETPALP